MDIVKEYTSPNYSKRKHNVEYVILHYTEMKFQDALDRLCDIEAKVSAHYLIKEDGVVYQLVQDNMVAWHAGVSKWHNKEKINQYSIGIELDNLGDRAFTNAQIESCLQLCASLKEKYKIKQANFIAHSDIAPDRKIDPGMLFDWQKFANQNFGYWHNIDFYQSDVIFKFGDSDKGVINMQKKLSALGYNLSISGVFDMQTNYVVRAFLSKYCPEIIMHQGIEFYKDNDSKYEWNEFADIVLNKLITMLDI